MSKPTDPIAREEWLRTAPVAEIAAAGRAMEPLRQPTLTDALEALAEAEVGDTPIGVKTLDHAVPAIRDALAALTPHVSAKTRDDWFVELKRWVDARQFEQDAGRCRQRDEGVDIDARIAEAVAFLTGERAS